MSKEACHRAYGFADGIDLGRHSIACLCRHGNLVHPGECEGLLVDMGGIGFMSITQIVGLTQYMSEAKARHVNARLIRPSGSADSYLQRMNMYRLLGIPMREEFTRRASTGRFIPMIRLDSDEKHGRAVDEVRDVIISHIGGGKWDPGSALDVSLSEIMDNIPVHSKSASDGIVGAQYYPRSGIVEVCVADSGQGIVSSMGGNPLYSGFTPEQMMMRSLEEGYGQYYNLREFNGAHTSGGRGLTYPKRLTQAIGGKMWVVSHGYALEVSEHGTSMLEGLYYPGTLISMRLPVRDGDRLLASDMFTDGPEVPITWNPQDGWVDHLGRQVDVDGVRGTDDGLW